MTFNMVYELSNFQLMANTGQASRDDRRITRGQEQQLLQVPFLPGPSGRQSLTFVGSTLWNALPSDIRLHSAAVAFKVADYPKIR